MGRNFKYLQFKQSSTFDDTPQALATLTKALATPGSPVATLEPFVIIDQALRMGMILQKPTGRVVQARSTRWSCPEKLLEAFA